MDISLRIATNPDGSPSGPATVTVLDPDSWRYLRAADESGFEFTVNWLDLRDALHDMLAQIQTAEANTDPPAA